MIEIIDAKFITSAPDITLVPPNNQQNEVVFLARSNVGKSSLLNALTNYKNLAKVSSTPGKTKLINYFDVTILNRKLNQKLYAKFIDLPGFGYAKVSKSTQVQWQQNLTSFIQKRNQIKIFIHLIDARHTSLDIDNEVHDFLKHITNKTQAIIKIFTKTDKLNQKQLSKLKKDFPDSIRVSNLKKTGINDTINALYQILSIANDDNI